MRAKQMQQLSRRNFLRVSAMTVAGGLAAAACTPAMPQPAQEAGSSGASAAATQTTLRMWHHWGGTRVPLMDTQIADFMVEHPDIEVEATLQPWERRLETLLASIAAGDPPDTVMLAQQDVPQFVKGSALLPLDDYMQANGITLDQYYAPDAKAMVWDGQVWNLPNSTGGAQNIMFYSPKLFEEVGLDPDNPPRTWAEMSAAAEALVVIEEDRITRLGVQLYGGGEGVMHYLACNDAAVISEDGRSSILDNDAAVETFEWMLDVTNLQGGIEQVAAFQSMASEFETDPFYSDLMGVRLNGSWYYFYIQSQAPEFEYRSTLAPVNNDSPWTGNFGNCWGYVIPTGVEHADASWELVKWLSYDMEGMCGFLTAQLQPASLKQCTEGEAFQNAPFWETLEAGLNTTRALPGIWPVYRQFEKALNDMREETLYARRTPAEAVAFASEELQKALDEFWAG